MTAHELTLISEWVKQGYNTTEIIALARFKGIDTPVIELKQVILSYQK